MKKFKAFILVFTLVLLSFITGCSLGFNKDKKSENTESIPEILSDVVFLDTTVYYDGQSHSIYATNIPQGLTVKYGGNNKTDVGSYKVAAFFYDESGNEVGKLKAVLTILEANEKIDVSKIKFNSIEVKYDGQPHSIECSNVPKGVIISYEGNNVTEVGTHNVVAIVKDANNVVLARLEATIKITKNQQTVPDEEDRWKGEISIETSLFDNAQLVRLSSLNTGAGDKDVIYLKQYAPYEDEYVFKTDNNTTLEIYSTTGVEIAVVNPSSTYSVKLLEGEVVLTAVKATRNTRSMSYSLKMVENVSLFPYDPQEMVDAEKMLKVDKSKSNLSMPTANIEYKKREGGLYINCNNPEQITNQCLHNALTRTDVSNQSVFFTFEHNNCAATASSRINGSFYYGYQVINRGTEDVYITVKNIGFHIDGAGCWLGEKEWIDFYNTKFVVKNYNNYTDAQKRTFNDYYGFSNNYQDPDNQAITYRLPAGEYMYVMGGTSADAYNNYNVFGTADYPVAVSGCSNGAVLFEVAGDNVEGVFYAYQDANKIQPNNNTHQGYVVKYDNDNHNYGSQYVGYDNCHGVVDAHLTWEFNDASNSGNLLVNYQHPVANGIAIGKQNAYKPLNSQLEWNRGKSYWVTHINPLQHSDAVGTDMTKYITVNSAKEEIVMDYDHLDGNGNYANIGNWMIDYMEHYTFVNHGSKDRKITVAFDNNGCVAVLVRDKDGKLIEGTPQYTIVTKPQNGYAGVYDRFSYTVTVPAKGYVQFVVEYNLLANASGYVKHHVELD